MAYKRRYKKRTYKKRAKKGGLTVGKAVGFAGTAMRAMSLAAKVARMVNVEYKWRNNLLTTLNLDQGGFIFPLHEIDKGDGATDRNGTSIKAMRLSGKLHFKLIAGSNAAVRVILFRGKNENYESYAVGTLANSSRGVLNDTQVLPYMARKDDNNMYDTKFLFDRTYTLGSGGRNSIMLNWDKKLYGHIQYQLGNGASDKVENGGLYLLVASDDDDHVNMAMNLKFSFVDN